MALPRRCEPEAVDLDAAHRGPRQNTGWLETEWTCKRVCVKQGDLHGTETCAGVRASIVALKRL